MNPTLPSKRDRKNIYDIVKALGIISIVIGHCHPNQKVVYFVYAYHLALFIFVSGIQYNIEKYSTSPSLFLQSRMRTMWPPFFCYLTFFTLTRNLSVHLQLLVNNGTYDGYTIALRVWKNFLFMGSETLGGALWFVPVMLVSMMAFAVIVYISYTYFHKFRLIPIILFSCLLGALGVHAYMKPMNLDLHTHTSLLLLPVLAAGYLMTYFHVDFHKFFRWFIAIPCFVFVYWAIVVDGQQILLPLEVIGKSPAYLYAITFCGIYFICYLAKVIEQIPTLSRAFAFVGRYTFDIMALHFLVIKTIDVCYGRWIGDSPERYSAFPCAYHKLWILYLSVSIFLCPWIRIGINKLLSLAKSGAQRIFGTPSNP